MAGWFARLDARQSRQVLSAVLVDAMRTEPWQCGACLAKPVKRTHVIPIGPAEQPEFVLACEPCASQRMSIAKAAGIPAEQVAIQLDKSIIDELPARAMSLQPVKLPPCKECDSWYWHAKGCSFDSTSTP